MFVDDSWVETRLFSVHGVSQGREAENRVTSALLSCLKAVPSLLVWLMDDRSGVRLPKVSDDNTVSYYQPRALLPSGEEVIPDGYVGVDGRGSHYWNAFVEVKTGTDRLESDQVEKYVLLAAEHEVKAVLTISNEVVAHRSHHPLQGAVSVPEGVVLVHFSWNEIVALLKSFIAVEPNWLVSELLRYLSHENSGVLSFKNMGSYWSQFLEQVSYSALTVDSHPVTAVADKLVSLSAFAALQHSGSVEVSLSGGEAKSFEVLSHRVRKGLVEDCSYVQEFKVDGGFSLLTVEADFKAKQLVSQVTFPLGDGRSDVEKIEWLWSQLEAFSSDLHSPLFNIQVRTKFARTPNVKVLSSELKHTKQLVPVDADHPIEDVSFMVVSKMGMNQRLGARSNSFIESYSKAVDFGLLMLSAFEVFPEATELPMSDTPVITAPVSVLPTLLLDELMKDVVVHDLDDDPKDTLSFF